MIENRLLEDITRLCELDTEIKQCLMKISTHVALNGESRNIHLAKQNLTTARSMIVADLEAVMIAAVGNKGFGRKLYGR